MPPDQLFVIAAAASLSALATWTVKTYIQHRLTLRRQTELETLKSALARKNDEMKDMLEARRKQQDERLQVYPKVVEMAYRIRNLEREATYSYPELNSGFRLEYAAHLRDLEEFLYRNKFHLEADGTLMAVHNFKNCAVLFHILLGDILYFLETGDASGGRMRHREALSVYGQLDELQGSLSSAARSVTGEAWLPTSERGPG